MKVCRGYTLVEVLVAATLSVLLLGVLAALLVLGFHTWRHSDARSQAQEQTLLVVASITAQVRHANPDSLVIIPSSLAAPRLDSLTLVSNLGPNGETTVDPASGDILWQDRVAIYGQAPGTVFLQQVPLPPNTFDPSPLTISTLTPSATDHVTAHNITELALTLEQNGVVHVVVQATVDTLVCQQETTVATVVASQSAASPSPSPSSP